MRFEITPEGEIRKYIWEAGDPPDLIIPEVIDGISVRSIGVQVFNFCSSRSVTLPKGLESIKDSAFYHSNFLRVFNFPETLKSIERKAFSCCTHLKSLELSKSLISIESLGFDSCYALECVELPKGLLSLESFIFSYCEALRSVVIPSSVGAIAQNAFYHCRSLCEILVENPAEVARVRGLLPEHLRGLVKVNPWSELRSAWIGAMVFGGLVDPRGEAMPADAGAGAPAGGVG
jgi:hypothetical protein